jgi:hypothetical protein
MVKFQDISAEEIQPGEPAESEAKDEGPLQCSVLAADLETKSTRFIPYLIVGRRGFPVLRAIRAFRNI